MENFTITLSNDGTFHSFGINTHGQLGLGCALYEGVSLPTPIPNLPQINMISCGGYFAVCVDHEGFIWFFGQLETENNPNFDGVPQKIEDIPPVVSVSCGYEHTNDAKLWSWGRNDKGQLCLGDKEDRSYELQKTSFSNICKLSAGGNHSLFENNKGEIFSCGSNHYGQCGLGHFDHQIAPSLIPNAPPNIVHFVGGLYHTLFLDSEGNVFSVGYNNELDLGHDTNQNGLGHFDYLQITPSFIPNLPPNIENFVCGYEQNLFLDSEGNVFSVGYNYYGELGLGHNRKQNVLNKIPNIPPIISCVGSSCYLIDFEGNLWTFGINNNGQLGHGDKTNINIPKVINTLKDIQQISYGCCGYHFIAKNSQNQIFVTGKNEQLVSTESQSVSIPTEIDSQYSTIWRDEFCTRAKSARK